MSCPGCCPDCGAEWDHARWLVKAHHALEYTKLNPNAVWRLHEVRGRWLYDASPNVLVDLGGEA